MNDQDRKHAGEVIDFIEAASRKKGKRKRGGFGVTISGNRNIVSGGDININTRTVVRPTVKPGPEHITPRQAARLQDLVRKAAERDVEDGDTWRSAMMKWWSILKRHFQVPTYREIPQELGEEAISWLRRRIAMNRRKARRAVDQSLQKDYYTAIYARARELRCSKGELFDLVHRKLGKRIVSLKQLGEVDLEKLYRILMSG